MSDGHDTPSRGYKIAAIAFESAVAKLETLIADHAEDRHALAEGLRDVRRIAEETGVRVRELAAEVAELREWRIREEERRKSDERDEQRDRELVDDKISALHVIVEGKASKVEFDEVKATALANKDVLTGIKVKVALYGGAFGAAAAAVFKWLIDAASKTKGGG